MSVLTFFLLLIGGLYLRLFFHEIGHLIAAKFYGIPVYRLCLGGDTFRFKIRGFEYRLGFNPFVGSINVYSIVGGPPETFNRKMASMYIAGPLLEFVYLIVFTLWVYAFFNAYTLAIHFILLYGILAMLDFNEQADLGAAKKLLKSSS